jgi:hypothetical protein
MSTSDAMRERSGTQEFAEPPPAALEHIEQRGSLLWFAPDRAQRLGLMKAMTEKGFVAWNATAGKYELTPLGRQHLAGEQRSARLQSGAAR